MLCGEVQLSRRVPRRPLALQVPCGEDHLSRKYVTCDGVAGWACPPPGVTGGLYLPPFCRRLRLDERERETQVFCEVRCVGAEAASR